MKSKINYPMGSVSHGTMLAEDLIPAFASELETQARTRTDIPAKTRKAHRKLVADIESRIEANSAGDQSENLSQDGYWDSDDASEDIASLSDALEAYAGPYFYFGSHPGDCSDYGYWLSEEWDEDFAECPLDTVDEEEFHASHELSIKVNDLSDVPKWFRGEVVVVNDHGNVTLYAKGARGLREIWSVV